MKFKTNLTKRLLSIMLCFVMVFTIIPSASITVRAAEASIPTIEGTKIYANGTPITIEAAEGGTAVWYINGNEKTYVNTSGSTGEDMSDWTIFGGMSNKTLNGNTSITINGGNVKAILGGGYNISGNVVGNCQVVMNGGSVTELSGGGDIGAEVSGDVYVKMTGGTVECIYASKEAVDGNAYVEVTGGHVTDMIYKVQYLSSKITGSLSLILTNSASVASEYLNVIRKSETNWEVTGNPEIPAGTSLVIAEGETLTIDRGESINNAGTIVNNGTVIVRSLNALLGNAVEGSGKIVYALPYVMSNNITDADDIEVFLNGAKHENVAIKTIDGKIYFDVPDGKVLIHSGDTFYYAKYTSTEVELQPYTPISDIVVTPEKINACEETVLTTTYTAGSEAHQISYEIVDAGDTEASISGNKLTAKYSGTVNLAVTLTDGYISHQKNVDIAVQQIVPTGIDGEVAEKMYAQSYMTLPSNAVPDNATYKALVWEIINPGMTEAIIENGKLVVSNPGIVSIRGKVANGLGYGKDYVTEIYEVVVEKVENGIYISHEWNGTALTTEMKSVPDDAKVLTSDTTEWVDGAWYFLMNDTIISERIIVNGTVNLVLPDGVTLTAGKGISVNEGNTLNIYAQTQNKGILNVPEDNLESGNAGIGGDKNKNGGTIQIHGGVINIDGAAEGAGIGGGFNGHSGIITIYDGDLSITGGVRSAGIGGGNAGSGNTVYIYGGKVKASGSGEAAGIGGGSSGSGGKVYIYGGTIEANGSGYNNGAGAGIGGGGGWSVSGTGADVIIKGGNVKATGGYYSGWSTYQAPEIGGGVGKSQNKSDTGTLTSDGEEKISLKTITLAGAEENTWITEINGLDYSVHDVRTLDVNKLYFYLPGDEIPTSTKAGEVEYFCIDENTLTYYSSHDWSNADGTCTRCCEICDHAGQSGTCGICGKNLHIHIWEYSADGATIKATCTANGCTNANGGSVTISKPADTTYTGSEIKAELTYSDEWQFEELTITYNDTDRVNVTGNDIEAVITVGDETVSVTYQIAKASISEAVVSAVDQVYNGSALTPDVSVTLDDKTLTKDTDYTVSYENNTNAGTATVTVTGTGNYTGTATGTFAITDETAPTGEIKIEENSWKEFLNEISFGLFFKNNVDVTITADGTGSEVAKVEYLLSDSALDAENLPEDGWTELIERNGVYSFGITSQNKGSVYAKITDTAGNDIVINSNGVVVYTDSTATESTVYHTYKSTEDLVIEVKLNGNTVKDLAFNGHEIKNHWSVEGNKVMIDGDYLGRLNVLDKGSSYPITIYFAPMGEETDKVTLEAVVNLVINKADGSVTDISDIGKTYDGTAVSAPTYTSLSSGTATYEYKVQGTDDSTYTTKAPDTVGDYVVRVTVAADHWYKEASATAEFSISEADLSNVSVVQNGTLTYTSEAQAAEVTTKATALGGQTVTFAYSTEENGTYGTMPEFVNVGNYTVYYKASAPNHNDEYGSFTVTIGKAVVTEPTIASKPYTGSAQTADVVSSDLYTVEQNNGGTAKGEYTVVLKLTDAENYKWNTTDAAEVTLQFVITGAENSWTTEPSIEGWTYGEEAKTPVYEAKFGTVKVNYTGTANDGTEYNSTEAPSEAGDYTATFTVDATPDFGGLEETVGFTIAKADVTVTAEDADKTYGDNDPQLVYSNTALVGEDELSGITVTRENGEDAGVYDIVASQIADANPNYNITFENGTFIIDKATLKVTAEDKTAVYGDKTPEFTVTFDGFKNNDDVNKLKGTLAFDCDYEQFADKDEYTITPKGYESDNYNFDYVDGKLTVGAKAITVTIDAKTSIYGDDIVALTATDNGIVNGDADVYRLSTSAGKTAGVGKYDITGATLDDNYSITFEKDEDAYEITARELTATVVVADKAYDGKNDAVITSAILNNVANNDDISLVNGVATFNSVEVADNIGISFKDFTLSGDDSVVKNYTLKQPAGVTASITNDWTPEEYSVTKANENGWLKDTFVITAAEGYVLSLTNTADGTWSETLTYDAETKEGSVTFYVKNVETGAISLAATENYKIDKTVPVGTVEYAERKAWQEFVSTITFGLFYNSEVTVKADADDTLSGVANIEYAVSDKALTLEEVKGITDWTAMPKNGVAVEVEDAKQFVYFVRITDKAGNVTYLSTDGAVYDTQAPVIGGVVEGNLYYTTQKFTVTETNLDEVTVNGSKVEEAGYVLTGDTDAVYTVVATDKAGNSVTVMVTMKTIASISECIKDLTTEDVTGDDEAAIKAVEDAISSVDTEDATEAEKEALESAQEQVDALWKVIEDTADEVTDLKDKVTGYDKDSVKSSDEDAVDQLIKDIEEKLKDTNLSEEQKTELEKALEDAKALAEQIDSDTKAYEDAEDVVQNLDKDNVTADDAAELTAAKEKLEEIVDKDNDNYTKEEKDAAKDMLDKIEELEKVIEDTQKAVDEAAKKDGFEDVTVENVTSDDKEAVEEKLDEIQDILDNNAGNLTEEQKSALEDAKADAEELLEEIKKNEQALDDALDSAKNITAENYDVDSKETLEETADKLEDIVDENNKNYTESEKDAAQKELDRVNELLDSIEEVEDVISKIEEAETLIDAIEDGTAIPDNKEAVEKAVEAKQAYDKLDEKEKSLVGDEKTQLVTELYEKAVDFQIIKGADGVFTKDSGKGLAFTANGAFDLFKAVKVNGKVIDAKNYTAKAGSTVIELKADYLQTLKDGSYTLEVVYEVLEEEHSADCNFTVKKAPVSVDDSKDDTTSGTNAPDTGDYANILGNIIVMMTSAMAIAVIAISKKRKVRR